MKSKGESAMATSTFQQLRKNRPTVENVCPRCKKSPLAGRIQILVFERPSRLPSNNGKKELVTSRSVSFCEGCAVAVYMDIVNAHFSDS